MNKYHVKFSHIVQLPVSDQSNIPTKIINVDDIYQIEPHVNIFTLIHSRFNVVGSISAILLNEDVSWVVTYPDGDEPGEIIEWYLTFEEALQNAKPGLIIAKEIHDKRKDYIYYTSVVKVIK